MPCGNYLRLIFFGEWEAREAWYNTGIRYS